MAGVTVQQVAAAQKKLQADVAKAKADKDLAKCSEQLAALKISLTQLDFLNPADDDADAVAKAVVARSVLESACLLSLRKKDVAGFERQVVQVMTYYYDTGLELPASESRQAIIGANLLRLLSQNRMAEFHTEVERIPVAQHSDPHLLFPMMVEQHLVEGNHAKVWAARDNVPHPSFSFFMDQMMDMIRDEIANCSEKAYESLKIADAQKMLMLGDAVAFGTFCSTRGWETRDGRVFFSAGRKEPTAKEIPAEKIIRDVLMYARELDRIV